MGIERPHRATQYTPYTITTVKRKRRIVRIVIIVDSLLKETEDPIFREEILLSIRGLGEGHY